jgi:uncharacterized membrane-anchored protein YitT (DUF2179 family)
MPMLSRIAVRCSYMIALVLAVAWVIGALRDIDTHAGGPIIAALTGVVLCGLGLGLIFLRLSSFGAAKLPDPGHIRDKSGHR